MVAFVALVCASGLAQKMPPDPTLVYIGTTGEKSTGIHLFRLQSQGDEVFQNVTLVPLGLAAETPRPSFIELDLKRRLLFAANEVDQGTISVFSIGPAGKLALIDQQPSKGNRPCQLALDKSGRHLLVAHCGDGTVSLRRLGADGTLGEQASSVKPASSSPAPCVAFDPEGRFAFVCGVDDDKIFVFRVNPETGMMTPNQHAFVNLKAGSAPRHVLFRQDGRFAYVANAKSSTITVFAYDAANGTLTESETVSTVPEYFDGANTAGELWIHRSSRWLYVANSGHNSLVQFTVDKEKGTLTFVEEQGTGGKMSRFFGMEPSSQHLAMSNTDSNTVLASRIDEGNGRLKPSGIFANLAAPASVRFLPPASASKGQ